MRPILTVLFALSVMPRGSAAGDPPASLESTPTTQRAKALDRAINFFLNTPEDLNNIWKALERPDFVLIEGEEYERLRRASRVDPSRKPEATGPAVISGVKVRGTVRGDLADLLVEITLVLESDAPSWVAIRLDGLTLTGSREADRDLPLRVATGGGWEIQLRGRGEHVVATTLVTSVRSTVEGRRLELPIPEAARTGLEIAIAQRVSEASTGLGEPIAVRHGEEPGSNSSVLLGEVAPRSTLAVLWRVEEQATSVLAPLLVAQGEIAIEVESGSIRTRSSWAIRSLRGSTRSLQFRLDPEDEVREIELDGQTPPAGIERVAGTTFMTIPLVEPLGPGQERRLLLTTRRAIPVGPVARLNFSGFPLTDAKEQTGAIGISRGSSLWVSATPGRGVRQIDPRTELPAELRSRPGTELAFQFSEQPLELGLKIEPSLPLVTTQNRSTVLLDRSRVKVETWLDYQTTRGRLFELNLGVPGGVDVESVGPEDLVKSWQGGAIPDTLPLGAAGLRVLTVRIAPRVQDGGRFSIQIVSRQRAEPSPSVAIGLIQPIGVLSGGGRIAVLAEPSLGVELAGEARQGPDLGVFRPALQSPPADWPWPSSRPPNGAPDLWLRYDETPTHLPLQVSVHPARLSHSTVLTARLDRRGADVVQEVECGIRFGVTDHLDLGIPQALEGRWEVESPSGVSRSVLGPVEGGREVVRLTLPNELTRSARFRFRYWIPLDSPLLAGATSRLSIPWIGLEDSSGAVAPVRATILLEPGISSSLDRQDSGWTVGGPLPSDQWATPDRLTFSASESADDPLDLRLSAVALAELPAAVIPRLWIRSILAADGHRLTTTSFAIESDSPWFSLALPRGDELLRAKVGGQTVARVERLPTEGGLRIGLSERSGDSPTVVEIESVTPSSKTQRPWQAPRPLGQVLVQQSYWELVIPEGFEVVGVPSGWTDENAWGRQGLSLRRQALRSERELASWLNGSGSPATLRLSDPAESTRLLFGRPLGTAGLPVVLASRAWLVFTCSGAVLALGGFLLLVWRPPSTIACVTLGLLGLSVAALVHPSLTFLVLQSGSIGLVLTVVIAWLQRRVERRQALTPETSEGSGLLEGLGTSEASLRRNPAVGADDSTAIRARPVSTIDYARNAPTPLANGAPGESAATGAWPLVPDPSGGS